jgi:hypothetical protein
MGLSKMLSKLYSGIVRFIEIMQDVQLERAKAYAKYGRIAE